MTGPHPNAHSPRVGAPAGRPVRILLLYADTSAGKALSYWSGWPRHFRQSSHFDCVPVNVGHSGIGRRLRNALTAVAGGYDGVVVLHSVFSNQRYLGEGLASIIRAMRRPTAIFLANEYKLMPEKLEFCDELGAALLVSQSHSPEIHRMYEERLKCGVMFLPNGGLDPAVFAPEASWADRQIDVGFRAYETPWYLGHDEKRDLADRCIALAPGLGLTIDVSMDPRDRFDERGWARFLNRCKAVLGAEAGTDYFELTDATRNRVNHFVATHPGASRDEVFRRFFADYRDRVSGRMLASRHIEAAGTKTLQILVEGSYGGVFEAGVHYVPVRRDASNLADAMEQLRDPRHCGAIVERAYDLVSRDWTFERLIERFHAAFIPLLTR
jgi:hypothetical protein